VADQLSVVPDGGRVRTFLCPACGETIALGCERCRFCSVSIDQSAAITAANLMDRVNAAVSRADQICLLCSWRDRGPGMLINFGPGESVYAVPILLFGWWASYGSLRCKDKDFLRAREDMKRYAWIAGALVAVLLIPCLYSHLRGQKGRS
jgi:hypothetical protein